MLARNHIGIPGDYRSRRQPLGGVALVATLVLLAACQPPRPEISLGDIERAQAALQPFKEQLVEALVSALEEGPENAIQACRDRAPEIASELSVGGIRMGRTSHRLRNPKNAPEPWMEPLLASYVENPQDKEPRTVHLDDSTFGYVEPIRVRHFCVSCHGPSVAPALEQEILSLYPEDRATGFRAGDFRGLFWVTMPLGAGGVDAAAAS